MNAAPVDKVIVRLFTGGSTGKPQVWPKTVGNLFGEAYFMMEKFNFSPEDCFVTTTVPYHIYGLLFAVLVPLVASARVAGGPSIYPQDITAAIARHKTTVFAGVPSHYRVLRDVTFQADHLRLAISSAGRLEPEDGTAFFRKTGVGVTEVYGSTETGGAATRNRAIDETTLMPLASVSHSHRRRTLMGSLPLPLPQPRNRYGWVFPHRRPGAGRRRSWFCAHGTGRRYR